MAAILPIAAAVMSGAIFAPFMTQGRVLGLDGVPPTIELGHPSAQLQGIPPPINTDVGFYVFLVSSIAAVIAAAGVLVTMSGNQKPGRTSNARGRGRRRGAPALPG